jgi:hypothetical protein
MPAQKFRILLFNVGYATALDGSLRNYFLRFYRYLYTPRTIIRKVRQAIYHLMEREKPDVCCFVEIHRKIGCVPHPHIYTCSDIDNKYGLHSILRRLPFFRDNCNGFFAKGDLAFEKYYFKNGTKKLIYEIRLRDDVSLFLAHFSLERKVRQKQFVELREIIKSCKNAILCGDFNIFDGRAEVEALAEACEMRIVNSPTESTFPAFHPSKTLDLFLCPKNIRFAEAKVLKGIHASDHLPVLLEMELA